MNYNKLPLTALVFICFAATFCSSCSFKGRQVILKTPYDADTVKTVRVVNSAVINENYYNLIKAEDELAIKNVQDMSLIAPTATGSNNATQTTFTTFKVNAAGEVVLPKIGAIKVAGLNRMQAAEAIQKAYEQKELNAPLIDVRIANAYVILLGEVRTQGKFVIEREDYELIDLLADAGGLTPDANKKMLRIFRGDKNNPEIIFVNLSDYSFLKDPRLKLRAKDVVYVEPRRVSVNSQNFQAYSTFIQIGFTIVNALLLIYTITK
ncbi:polysaccharide biosynthesis/export family protein [Pedobacter xixiisoli]|uniref:Polysaccharide export outer membrane protein n=1 Tax=Pedobacter xixiisoli TaxID=1476464 RepID=A0A286A9U1_9SPHI|nr:polysaccharide biosynthesis/export family protein [Pedobacter xixiisoli]SOD18676.1 polysaccharide export outer membrane protein [Pedobacter xixiisoli]